MAALPRVTFVLGGCRSGKSAFAEALFDREPNPVYLATATAGDPEMTARIAAHRIRRGERWRCVEEPLALAAALQRESRADRPILVDCLTLWVSNLMAAGHDVAAAGDALLGALSHMPGPLVLVSNEVGFGIVPDNALARSFRDHAGLLHQHIAQKADRVVLVVAGLPLFLKGAHL